MRLRCILANPSSQLCNIESLFSLQVHRLISELDVRWEPLQQSLRNRLIDLR